MQHKINLNLLQSLGSHIVVRTVRGDTYKGELYCYDNAGPQNVILKESLPNGQCNFTIVKLGSITETIVERVIDTNAMISSESFTPINPELVARNINFGEETFLSIAHTFGVGVSKRAQELFEFIYKTHPSCKWNDQSISVMDVVVDPPYTSDCCHGGETRMKDRIKQVVSRFQDRQNSRRVDGTPPEEWDGSTSLKGFMGIALEGNEENSKIENTTTTANSNNNSNNNNNNSSSNNNNSRRPGGGRGNHKSLRYQEYQRSHNNTTTSSNNARPHYNNNNNTRGGNYQQKGSPSGRHGDSSVTSRKHSKSTESIIAGTASKKAPSKSGSYTNAVSGDNVDDFKRQERKHSTWKNANSNSGSSSNNNNNNNNNSNSNNRGYSKESCVNQDDSCSSRKGKGADGKGRQPGLFKAANPK